MSSAIAVRCASAIAAKPLPNRLFDSLSIH